MAFIPQNKLPEHELTGKNFKSLVEIATGAGIFEEGTILTITLVITHNGRKNLPTSLWLVDEEGNSLHTNYLDFLKNFQAV